MEKLVVAGIITDKGRQAREFIRLSRSLDNAANRDIAFAMPPEKNHKDQTRRGKLLVDLGLSSRRRIRNKQTKRMEEELTSAGYPQHWLRDTPMPKKEKNLYGATIYSKI